MIDVHSSGLPRVLVFVANEISEDFSTGITVANLFRDWPADNVAQLCLVPSPSRHASVFPRTAVLSAMGGIFDIPVRWGLRKARAAQAATELGVGSLPIASQGAGFGRHVKRWLSAILEMGPLWIDTRTRKFLDDNPPDVIYSPMSGIRMMRIARRLSLITGAPLVPHLLDDWPASLYVQSELGGAARSTMRDLLHGILTHAPGVAVISDAMSSEYRDRYGISSTSLMNCVDLLGTPKVATSANQPVRFAYVGGLHLGRATLVSKVAAAIDATPGATLHVHSPRDDLERYRSLFAPFSSVSYGPSLPADAVPAALTAADVLVHVESFDADAVRYTRLSISTKIPQYLAAARPILAVGPQGLASTQHLLASASALVLDELSIADLISKIKRLTEDVALRQQLSASAVAFAAKHHYGPCVRGKLEQLLMDARR